MDSPLCRVLRMQGLIFRGDDQVAVQRSFAGVGTLLPERLPEAADNEANIVAGEEVPV